MSTWYEASPWQRMTPEERQAQVAQMQRAATERDEQDAFMLRLGYGPTSHPAPATRRRSTVPCSLRGCDRIARPDNPFCTEKHAALWADHQFTAMGVRMQPTFCPTCKRPTWPDPDEAADSGEPHCVKCFVEYPTNEYADEDEE